MTQGCTGRIKSIRKETLPGVSFLMLKPVVLKIHAQRQVHLRLAFKDAIHLPGHIVA